MTTDGFGAIRKVTDHPPQLSIHLSHLIATARSLHTQVIIQEKYQVGGLRAWKVLQTEGHLELPAVARLAMLD